MPRVLFILNFYFLLYKVLDPKLFLFNYFKMYYKFVLLPLNFLYLILNLFIIISLYIYIIVLNVKTTLSYYIQNYEFSKVSHMLN